MSKISKILHKTVSCEFPKDVRNDENQEIEEIDLETSIPRPKELKLTGKGGENH